ncbi:hypothetical protein ACTMS0_22285 [Micromonospora sp. H33]|uniref:hypothetical protein n=1 Tax=Micromonospora sp. H33 TaxID=3452215 RepID=UPI003F8C612B
MAERGDAADVDPTDLVRRVDDELAVDRAERGLVGVGLAGVGPTSTMTRTLRR